MTRFALDTNVVVAMARVDHTDHAAALDEVERRLNAGDILVVPTHVVVESYSVLTRIPAPFRLRAGDAFAFLEELLASAQVADLGPDAYLPLLRDAAQADVRGGQIHDLVIASIASGAGADLLLTFNTRHFASMSLGIQIREPVQG
jgi:predicted nucleic acid-binding protein